MIIEVLTKIFRSFGYTAGKISCIICPVRTYGIRNLMSRAFHTARHKRQFKNFGKGSLISRDSFIVAKGNISIGENTSIQSHSVLETIHYSSEIFIGDNVSIGEYCHITSASLIKIGNGVLTGRFVLITDNSHGKTEAGGAGLSIPPLWREVIAKGDVVIGRNVWIGDKASILPGVTIGEGAIIAANAVVTKDIPPFVIAAGCPAKVIKTLKS